MNLLALSPYVFDTNLTWYSVFVLVGAIVTYIVSNYFYRKDKESEKCPDLILNTFLLAFPAGLLGARIWYVLSELDYYLADPISILRVWEGGLAIQGGVILGALVGIVYARHLLRKNGMTLKITTVMDMIIPNILIAQVIGRWGNFFNREVYGACVDRNYALKNWWMLPNWLVEYMRGGLQGGEYIPCAGTNYAQPLFLYEGILNFIGFVLISIILRKLFTKRVDGSLSAFYLIWYGAVRLCLEPLRNEVFIMRWGKYSQSIITSAVYVLLGIAFLIYLYAYNCKNKKLALIANADMINEIKIAQEKEDVVVEEKIEVEESVVATETKEEVKKEVQKEIPVKKSTTSKKAPAKTVTKKVVAKKPVTSKKVEEKPVVKKSGTKTTSTKKTTTKATAKKVEAKPVVKKTEEKPVAKKTTTKTGVTKKVEPKVAVKKAPTKKSTSTSKEKVEVKKETTKKTTTKKTTSETKKSTEKKTTKK